MFITNSNKKFQKVIVNFTGTVRSDTMGGRSYLVAPMIMIVEGVLNGSSGALLYPVEELKKNIAGWNNKPVVLNHPENAGMLTTACTPAFITDRGLGVIMNARVEDNKLKAEAWLEVDRVEEIDNRVLEAIRNKQMMELSTGLTCDVKEEEGKFNGKSYSGIISNISPDHLAILPDDVGASSIEDGAGFLRLNKENDTIIMDVSFMEEDEKKFLIENRKGLLVQLSEIITNQLSHDTIRELIWSRLRDADEEAWIAEIFDSFFVYTSDGKLWRQGYSVQDGTVEFVGMIEEVTQVVEFRKMDGTVINVKDRKESAMDKKKFVDGLISNERTKFTEDDRESLMAMNEALLEKMEPKAVANEEESTEDTQEDTTEKDDTQEDTVINKAQTTQEYIDKAPSAIQEMLQNGLDTHNAEKTRYIKLLLDNKQNTFTEEQLKGKKLGELRQLVNLAANTAEKKEELAKVTNFSGQAETVQNNTEEEALEVPVINFQEKVKEKEVA